MAKVIKSRLKHGIFTTGQKNGKIKIRQSDGLGFGRFACGYDGFGTVYWEYCIVSFGF